MAPPAETEIQRVESQVLDVKEQEIQSELKAILIGETINC